MKKQVLTILLIIIVVVVNGQNWERSFSHHDIMIGYGVPSLEGICDFNSPLLNDVFPEERYVRDDYNGTGVASFGYRYIPKNGMVMFGISGSYHASKAEVYNLGQYQGDLKRDWYSVVVDFQYRYKNLNKIQLYSGVAVGYVVGNEKLEAAAETGVPSQTGDISKIAWQINAIGMRYGGDFGGFFELGYGYKGIVNFGISYQIF